MTEFQRRLEANIRESLRFAVGEVQDDAVAHMVAGVNAVLNHPCAPAPSQHVAVETVRALETANAPKHMIEAACKVINDRGKGNNVTIADVAFMLDAAISASPAQHLRGVEAAVRSAGIKARDELLERMADGGTVDNDLADYMTRIVDACVRAALATTEGSTDGQ